MNIIQASAKHIPTIREIVDITWPVTYGDILSEEQIRYMIGRFYSNEVLEAQLSEPDHRFFLAEEDGTVYGFAGIQLNYPTNGITKLHKIYILPSAQGKNIGRTFIDYIVETASTENQSTILLNVNRYNKAKQFYEKIGFSVVRDEDIDIGNGYLMEDHVMELKIEKAQ